MVSTMNAIVPYSPERRGLPLKVDAAAGRESAATSFIRAAACSLIAAAGGRTVSAESVARSRWPSDRDVPAILKATSAPASVGNSGWAGTLAHVGHVVDIISTLAPSSVAAKVLGRCLSLEWPPGVVAMTVPTISVNSSATGWVGEGAAIPTWDFITSAAALSPRKIATICIFSRELAERSTPNIEALLRVALSESLGIALDRALFSAAPGDSVTPTGLFSGISATAVSNASIPSEAMTEDLSRLTASVATVAGDNPILLIMSPRQAAAMKVRTDIGQFETYSSSALPDGTVCAIASNALASVGDRVPTFEASAETALHEDTAPASSLDQATTSVKTLFQTDCLALRIRYSINWVLRSTQGVWRTIVLRHRLQKIRAIRLCESRNSNSFGPMETVVDPIESVCRAPDGQRSCAHGSH
jgi:hypothetical protein